MIGNTRDGREARDIAVQHIPGVGGTRLLGQIVQPDGALWACSWTSAGSYYSLGSNGAPVAEHANDLVKWGSA